MASHSSSRFSSKPTAPDPWNPTVRSVVSLLLVIHFTCVFVVLSSNNYRSALQTRLVRIFGFYTQQLNFDPSFTPYALTFGDETDDVAFVVDLYERGDLPVSKQKVQETVTLPDHGSKLLDQQKRYFNLGRLMALNSNPLNPQDDITGEVVRAVGARVMREKNCGRCVVRCLRRSSQPMNVEEVLPGFPRDNPTAAAYDIPIYEADVWFDDDGLVQAIKRSAQNEVAPQQGGS